MRKLLVSLLVASALMPAALARDGSFGRGGRAHAERSDRSSEDRPRRAEHTKGSGSVDRPVRVERVQDSNGGERRARTERAERPVRAERNVRQARSLEPVQRVRRIDHTQSVERVQHVRRVDHRNGGFAGGIHEVGRQAQTREQRRGEFSGLHHGIVHNGNRTGSYHRWSRDWHHDHRYDWRNYRDRHRTIFRIGRYYDPYGWGYRRFSTGFNLWPSYYGSRFWLNDPWQYRLPPAYGPYRWVRYYDDALLVNIYSGQVVDVVYNFFW